MTAMVKKRVSAAKKRPFMFLHVGDLHLTQVAATAPKELIDRERQLESDLSAVLANIASIDRRFEYDFVFLPGDLAENACCAEYNVLLAALQAHRHLKVRLIPGDHDRARGDMKDFANFRAALTGNQSQDPPRLQQMEVPFDDCPDPRALLTCDVEQFFFEQTHNGVCCLFLDLVSASHTRKVLGLDFRLGIDQYDWLAEKVMAARERGQPCAVYMHCYPEDMREPDDRRAVAGLFWDGGVRLVEMGHTHYNEIAHDGRTMYATARSVGQNEDGPVGYAVGAIDGAVTSWRFKQLQQTWPFVLITSPADRRLATEPLQPTKNGMITVRAVVLSDRDPTLVQCRVDDGQWRKMHCSHANIYELDVNWRPGARKIAVKASDDRWKTGWDFLDIDTIEPAPIDFKPRSMPKEAGSDKLRVGIWRKKGVRGDQLGPNSGGRKW